MQVIYILHIAASKHKSSDIKEIPEHKTQEPTLVPCNGAQRKKWHIQSWYNLRFQMSPGGPESVPCGCGDPGMKSP